MTQAKPPIGWLKFTAQLLSVALAYLAFSALPIIALGITSASAALSSFFAMVGGVLIAWPWLRKNGEFKQVLGLLPISDWRKTLELAAISIAGTIAIFVVGSQAVKAMGLDSPQTGEVIGYATQSPAHFAMWIVFVAWLGAGFGEEVLFRGFLMDRLSRLKGIGSSTAAVLIIQAVIFGLPHAYQGLGGVLITGTVGLLFGWIRLRANGVIWAGVIGHAAVDTIMLSMAYSEKLGWIGS